MTSMKHYHLGCGESLQSSCKELQKLIRTTYLSSTKGRLNSVRKPKPGKQH
jgi:hypothetical protein